MRRRFLLRYLARMVIRLSIVIGSWSLGALATGLRDMFTVMSSILAYILAVFYTLSTGLPLNYALVMVGQIRGVSYVPITTQLIINAVMPTLRSFLVLLSIIYAIRYTYDVSMGHGYAAIALSVVAVLISIIAGQSLAVNTITFIVVLLATISAIHTYYYAVNLLGPYLDRVRRVQNVLSGNTHVPIERLKAYVKEMRKKDRNFWPRLTLEYEIGKLSRVAFSSILGSIMNIILAIAVAYATYFLSQIVFSYSSYKAISSAAEIGQPEMFMVFVALIGSAFYLFAVRYTNILNESSSERS